MKCTVVGGLALLLAVASAMAAPSTLPDYYQSSDFLLTTPSVSAGGAGGMFNPAAWGLGPDARVGFYWNDLKNEANTNRNWALAFDGGLGFTMQHWDFTDAAKKTQSLTDYQIGFGAGDRSNRFGLAYGWSKVPSGLAIERDKRLSIGGMHRPIKQISFGGVYTTSLSDANNNSVGVIDLGIRPFGTPLLTIFGDASMGRKDRIKDAGWSAGIAVEPLPGLSLRYKQLSTKDYQLGLTYTVMTFGASATPHYDKNGSQTYTTYGVMVGEPIEDVFSQIGMKNKQTLKLDFNSDLKYRRYLLFDHGGMTLTEALEVLDNARKDPRIAGVVLKITEEMTGSWELIWEVREKIKEVQASGKKVVAYFERGDMRQYYLASVADKMMVDPETMVGMMGFNLGRTYYKNALDKLGIGFDEWRFFKYKSAVEGFSRTSMSDGDREQRLALAEGFYNILRADICASRSITPAEFDHIIDNVGILSADSLLTYKMADTTGRWDDFEGFVEKVQGSKPKMMGIHEFEMITPVSRVWSEPPQIAVIYALGPCSMNDGINARVLEKVIKDARENKQIKAVVFRVDSPGGDILPSDIVAVELKKTAEKKPVIVSQGFVAGSGGYWISMYGQKIVASPWTITGSIGVIGGWMYDKGLGDKIGLNYDHVQVGKHADLGGGIEIPLLGAVVPNRNLSEEERALMEKRILMWYETFVTKVADGRKLDKEKVKEIAQGRVWTGTAGKGIGLVDELGGLDYSIKLAREAAKIGENEKYEIKEMPELGLLDPAMFAPKLMGITLPQHDVGTDYLMMMLKSEGKPMAIVPPEYIPSEK